MPEYEARILELNQEVPRYFNWRSKKQPRNKHHKQKKAKTNRSS